MIYLGYTIGISLIIGFLIGLLALFLGIQKEMKNVQEVAFFTIKHPTTRNLYVKCYESRVFFLAFTSAFGFLFVFFIIKDIVDKFKK